MTTIWWLSALVLLVTVVAGLVFVSLRPGGAESMLAALLFGTTGVALALVLGRAAEISRAIDVAAVLALLAGVLGVAFVVRGWSSQSGRREGSRWTS
jgi:multicomponent Na+:H+ antiporter subunit F